MCLCQSLCLTCLSGTLVSLAPGARASVAVNELAQCAGQINAGAHPEIVQNHHHRNEPYCVKGSLSKLPRTHSDSHTHSRPSQPAPTESQFQFQCRYFKNYGSCSKIIGSGLYQLIRAENTVLSAWDSNQGSTAHSDIV